MLLNSLRVTRLPTEADIQFSFFNRILLLPLSSGWAPVLINSALFLKRVPLWPCKANNYLNWHLTPCIVVVMLVELCSAHCLPPCPVNLKRSAGGQLKEVVEVSVAEAFRQLEGDLTLMLKISRLSPSVPPPPHFFSLFFVCVCACICVPVCVRACFPQVWKVNIKSRPPKASEQEKKTLPRCSAPKGQHNVTFDLFLSAHKNTSWNLRAF